MIYINISYLIFISLGLCPTMFLTQTTQTVETEWDTNSPHQMTTIKEVKKCSSNNDSKV